MMKTLRFVEWVGEKLQDYGVNKFKVDAGVDFGECEVNV